MAQNGAVKPTADGAHQEKPISVFYSYSHRDEAFCDELKLHLSFLRRSKLIAEWHDRMIAAGDCWKGQIDRQLAAADIILLLISADFIASDYCWGEEMAKALARHQLGEARVIPVILRPCRWQSTPLGSLQAVPRDGKAISSWTNRDEAWIDVVSSITRVCDEIHGEIAPATPEPTTRHAPLSLTTTFTSFSTAAPNIESVLDEYRGRVSKPRLQVLGIVLYYQWPIVESYLARVLSEPGSKHLEGWQIQIALLDPEWPYAKELNSRFPADARGAIERMRSFVSNNEKLMRDHNWSFDVFTFQYVPHWVGIRIGDDVLYLCRSFWDNKQLRGGRNMVQMVTAGASTLEDQMVDEFRGWFLYSQQKKENVWS